MQPVGEGQALRPGGRAGRRTAAGLLLFPNLEKRPSSPSGTRWKAPEGLLSLTLRSLMLSTPQAAPGGVAAAWRWDFPGSPGSKQGALVPPAPGTKSPRVSELHRTTWPSRPSHRGSEEPESTWQLLGPLPASPGPSWTSLCTPVPSAAFHPGEVSEDLATPSSPLLPRSSARGSPNSRPRGEVTGRHGDVGDASGFKAQSGSGEPGAVTVSHGAEKVRVAWCTQVESTRKCFAGTGGSRSRW